MRNAPTPGENASQFDLRIFHERSSRLSIKRENIWSIVRREEKV